MLFRSDAAAASAEDAASLRPVEERPTVGEPVDGVTGEVCIAKTDFVLPGALALALKRTYASNLEGGSLFGPKWRSTWGQWVEEARDAATFCTSDGRSIQFALPAGRETAWVRNAAVDKVRLRRTKSGFEVRDAQLHILQFALKVKERWLLTGITDRNGNALRLDRKSTRLNSSH